MHGRISIDGHTEISFTEDVAARFVALGWHVQHVKDGNTDLGGLRAALDAAKADPRPSFIKACPSLLLCTRSVTSCDRPPSLLHQGMPFASPLYS